MLPTSLAGLDLGGADWLILTSGEWLRGEITLLHKETLEFDSQELDDLSIDWGDVAELRSSGPVTCFLEGRDEVTGRAHVTRAELLLTVDGEVLRYPRSRLLTLIPGEPKEANYWSGKLSLGVSLRRGNTNQAELTANGRLRRQTSATRLELQYVGAFGELNGVENVNNHRSSVQHDVNLTRRLYLTPLRVEYFRDPFQNIETRFTPAAGGGYSLVDTSRVEWEVGAGAGYQYTRFGTVAAGLEREDSTAAMIFGTDLDLELTDRVDLNLDYQITVPVPESELTNHNILAVLSVELTDILDLDVTFRWDRIESPRPDAAGNVPERDDFRLSVGLGVEF